MFTIFTIVSIESGIPLKVDKFPSYAFDLFQLKLKMAKESQRWISKKMVWMSSNSIAARYAFEFSIIYRHRCTLTSNTLAATIQSDINRL